METPLLRSDALDEAVGGRVLVKAEALQRTGSFKFRGAYNRLSRLSAWERRRGVVAYSSGIHAQGVAAAAKLVGLSGPDRHASRRAAHQGGGDAGLRRGGRHL